jgi:hypothetical protein
MWSKGVNHKILSLIVIIYSKLKWLTCEMWVSRSGENDDVALGSDGVWTRRCRRSTLSAPSALKMERECFSEPLVYTYESTRQHNPGEQHG